jgi:hypothetical protein
VKIEKRCNTTGVGNFADYGEFTHLINGCSMIIVLQNYRSWLGEPESIDQPIARYPELSPDFSILTYPKNEYYALCTAGGSQSIIPMSKGRFGDDRGVAYEYILHSDLKNLNASRDLLLRICSYPYLIQKFIYSGDTFPIGDDFCSIPRLNYIYLTFPYEEDISVYSESPKGQIMMQDRLIQTFWAIPIFEEEAKLLKKIGPTKFDELLGNSDFQAYNLHRRPLPPVV